MKAFITGASSGIGQALAIEIARRYPGAIVGLSARRQSELDSLATRLKTEFAAQQCVAFCIDVTDYAALKSAAAEFVAQFGVPDLVIANAGISAGTAVGEAGDDEVFRRIIAVNVNGLHATLDAFVPAMTQRGTGTLVGIGSVAGVRGLPGAAAYSASKAAVRACMESLRVELRGSGVCAVTIAPGYIATPMTQGNQYPMPFLMPAEKFAIKALDAVSAHRRYVVIPWQMGWVARLLGAMPGAIYDRLFANAPRKARQQDAAQE